MAQLVRAPPCHGGGRRFEPDLGRLNGVLAQLGEHLPYKQRVIGSSPIGPIYVRILAYAVVAELADAQDLKSCGTNLPYRFDSGRRHYKLQVLISSVFETCMCVWLSWIERLTTDQKVGSSNLLTHVVETLKPKKFQGFFAIYGTFFYLVSSKLM